MFSAFTFISTYILYNVLNGSTQHLDFESHRERADSERWTQFRGNKNCNNVHFYTHWQLVIRVACSELHSFSIGRRKLKACKIKFSSICNAAAVFLSFFLVACTHLRKLQLLKCFAWTTNSNSIFGNKVLENYCISLPWTLSNRQPSFFILYSLNFKLVCKNLNKGCLVYYTHSLFYTSKTKPKVWNQKQTIFKHSIFLVW